MDLELGGGENPVFRPNFDKRQLNTVDRNWDANQELLEMFSDDSIDRVRMCHFLEHIRHLRARELLKDIYRVLKTGGTLEIIVPDLTEACKKYLKEGEERRTMWGIYGGQEEESYRLHLDEATHYWGYNAETLGKELQIAGFSKISILPERQGSDGENKELRMLATK